MEDKVAIFADNMQAYLTMFCFDDMARHVYENVFDNG